MQTVQDVLFLDSSGEELLPGFSDDFPYIATRARLDQYADAGAPWHWHRTVELFYMERGCLEYSTPDGTWQFPAGSGGMVNSSVLHTSRVIPTSGECVQLLHLFDPVFLSGGHDTRLSETYILPLTTSGITLLPLRPEDPAQGALLRQIRAAFACSPTQWGYGFQLRAQLSELWLGLLRLAQTQPDVPRRYEHDASLKQMLLYIHRHITAPLSMEQLCASAHVSRRGCFRLFRDRLHTTPLNYIQCCRMRLACRLLLESDNSITQIAEHCGFGSSSYFARLFQTQFHCTPSAYRAKWHDPANIRHKTDCCPTSPAVY